jgi:hypothetical protein
LTSSSLRCPPRFTTERNLERPTVGGLVEDYHFLLTGGDYFMPHQRFIADVAHELDPATGLLWYDLIVIIIPRQNGKTTYIVAKLARSAEIAPWRQLIYAAQNADKAREKLIDEWYDRDLARHPYFGPRTKPRRSNGSAHIRWTAGAGLGSRIFIVPSNDSMADGKTVDDGVLDEAFVYADTSVIASIQPTMATRADPQLTIVSTVGEGDDGLLLHYQDVGLAAINDPDARIALFEWSADDDADGDDPAVWAQCMPALGTTITVERIRSYRTSMTNADFDRAWLCRRPTIAQSSAIDMDLWTEAAGDADVDLPITAPFVTGVHIHPTRSHTSVAVAGGLPDGRVGVVVDRRPGTGWVVDVLEQLTARHSVAIVADRSAGAGGIIDRAAGRGLAVDELSGVDVGGHCGTLVDELEQRSFAHQDQPDLNTAAAGSRWRPLGGARAFDQRAADVPLDPIQAATWALGHYRRLFPAGARIDRIT